MDLPEMPELSPKRSGPMEMRAGPPSPRAPGSEEARRALMDLPEMPELSPKRSGPMEMRAGPPSPRAPGSEEARHQKLQRGNRQVAVPMEPEGLTQAGSEPGGDGSAPARRMVPTLNVGKGPGCDTLGGTIGPVSSKQLEGKYETAPSTPITPRLLKDKARLMGAS